MRDGKPRVVLFFYFLIVVPCSTLLETAHAEEEQQWVCSFKTQIAVAGHSTSNPQAKIHVVDNKYVFIAKGNKGTYINLNYPDGKGPLAVHNDGPKVTLIEKNTSDNLFVVTIFLGESGGLHEAIMSIHSVSPEIEHYFPQQLYGTCK